MTAHQKLSLIQQEFKTKKSRYNSFGKYNFRSAEDILEALKPINNKYKIYFIVTETLENLETGPVIKSTATMYDTESKDSIEATAIVGVDLNQKGMQTPQQYGSASSYGKKYALGNLLLIDDTADSDAVNTHGKSNVSQSRPSLNTNNLDKAKSFLSNGGNMATLKSKYNIEPSILKQLEEIV
jgi:hypothetical protein|tara:strand:- start:2455 stop:3003 length:549 start_codon:yes stop_codon:yes gene_type:complete